MSIKHKKKLQRIPLLPKRWERRYAIFGISLLAVGTLLLLLGTQSFPASAASQSQTEKNAVILTPMTGQSSGSTVDPLTEEPEWGMWHKEDAALSFPTRQQSYSMGQTITVPKVLSIRVDGIDRQWTPQSWQLSPSPVGYQD